MTTYIYALTVNDTPFYVGKTNNPARRLNEHINESKRRKGHNKTKERLIRDLLAQGYEITLQIITVCKSSYQKVETFYINYYSMLYDLVNAERKSK